jgi:hypothetical protein
VPPGGPSAANASDVTQADVSALLEAESGLAEAPRFGPAGRLWPSPADERGHASCADRLRISSQFVFARFAALTQISLILSQMSADRDRAVARLQATSAAALALETLTREKQTAQGVLDDCGGFSDVADSARRFIASLDRAADIARPIAIKLGAAPRPHDLDAAALP